MAYYRQRAGLFALIAILLSLPVTILAVKHENFKTCDQSGFCKRNRAYADEASASSSTWTSPYDLDPATISVKNGELKGIVTKKVEDNGYPIRLPLVVSFLESGVARVTIDEERRQKGDIELRHSSQARKERYNETPKWALVGGLTLNKKVLGSLSQEATTVPYGPNNQYKAVVKHSPFAIDFYRDDEIHIKFNGKGFLNIEQWRPKVESPSKDGDSSREEGSSEQTPTPETAVQQDESTWWEETFGGNTDSKPKGPESIGLDITFPDYQHVYGVPSHTGPLSLKETRGGSQNYNDPYRLYNSDVFEYELDSPMTLYGAIPLMHAHRKDSTVGILWLNGAETWIDITKPKQSTNPLTLGIGAKVDTQTHWFSEAGILDIFVFLGPTPKKILDDYTSLTGYTQLPQQFAIAYHQCRWNYVSDEDVRDVDRKFDRSSIPYDVIWLDLEYTDEKKYFTWDPHTFPDSLGMQKQLDSHGRKLVVIIDPHIKNTGNYPVVDALKSKDLAVHNKDKNLYEGWCWPGSSHWIDCFNPAARKWWDSLFTYSSFTGTAPNLFLWNDMNEPSVFNGPETTMPKDNIHHGNWEHRDLHNINGLTFVNATFSALLARDPKSPRRPFVLTRSFFVGSQRMGAMWTGDNQASWPHLAASIPMVLSQNIAGFPFSGADVGGFFGNPDKELLARWYQTGAFYPFFRGHAHIDTRRREPYLAPEPYKSVITQALRLRYSLLPAWYTAFHRASISGDPILKPHFYEYPSDEGGFTIDDQFFVGDTGLLAHPVTTEGADKVDIYLPPDGQTYYDYFTFTPYPAPKPAASTITTSPTGRTITLDAPLHKIPLLIRGGSIIPRKDRPRRSSALMKFDPYTLLITLSSTTGSATGSLYIDDGESYDYQEGAYIHRNFTLLPSTSSSSSNSKEGDISSGATLTSTSLIPKHHTSTKKSKAFAQVMENVRIEKIIIVGVPRSWKEGKEVAKVVNEEGGSKDREVEVQWFEGEEKGGDWIVVRDPGVGVGKGWEVRI